MPPPSAVFSTSSSSTVGPSPAKRRKLAGQLTGPNSARSSSRATSISSKSTVRPVSSASSAATPFEDAEHAAARRASVARVLSVWESLEQRYARAMDEDDIVDLRSGKLVQDRGVLKRQGKPWHYGKLLQGGDAEDKDDGATTEGSEGLLTTGNDDEEDEEDEEEVDNEVAVEQDRSLDELQLVGETDRRDESESSEDEFGEWDTVPAPPSASPSPTASRNQSRASSPGPAHIQESRPTTPGTLSTFLQANFRPKLEKLAKEREDSPAPPADDLQAFLAAERGMKAKTRPGYTEPDPPSDDDEVTFLGYGTGQDGDAAPSEFDEFGDDGDDSEDELNDWATVPAPPSEDEDVHEEDVHQEEERYREPSIADYQLPAGLSSDSDSEPSGPTGRAKPSSVKDNRTSSPTRPNRGVPQTPKRISKKATSSSEESVPSETKSKLKSSLQKKGSSKEQAKSSSTTLTPAMNRLMREPLAEVRRTPSRHLIPEVVIPYRGLSSSPTKKNQATTPTSPKKQTKPPSVAKPRTAFPTLSDSDDDAPLTSLRTPKQSPKKTGGAKAKPTYIELDSDDEIVLPKHSAKAPARDQNGSKSSKSTREQKSRGKSGDEASSKTAPKGKEKAKERGAVKKRKRESVEEVRVETQFLERMGSLGLGDSDDEEEEARLRATASWQRAVSRERPVSPVSNDTQESYQEEGSYDQFGEYEQPVASSSRAVQAPRAHAQPQQIALPPLPQPPVPPSVQQQQSPSPQPVPPNGYPGFYFPPGLPYMQMQMPVQMQMPMAMPVSMTPQFYYPPPPSPFITTPQMMVPPQPQTPQSAPANPTQEALLTQVLYTLNLLAHQNAGNGAAGNNQQQQPSTPTAVPGVQRDADGFAIPLPPETPQQDWRVASTPVTSMPSRQAAYESDPSTPSRSILRVGGSRGNGGGRQSSLGLNLDPKSKGKGKDVADFSDSGSEYEGRRAMSVTFSDPPSAETPKGRYAPLLSSPLPARLQQFAAPRPSPLRKSSSNLDLGSDVDGVGAWTSPASSPTKRGGRQPLAPANAMPSLDRRGSDASSSTSSAPMSTSSEVLAKARAALSSSLATTASFATPQSGRAGRR